MSRDAVEQIKARLSIVDVVESYVKLTKAGKNYKARSPFTNERTPSFFVSPDQGLYYCFSSGKGGDMFTFVQEMEGADFAGALKQLAERAGVELKKEDPKARSERDAVYTTLEIATRFYEAQVPKQEQVIEYLKGRGITGITAKKFRIGYSSEGWNALYDFLLSKGVSVAIMEKAGLVARGDKGYYDRFRGRIMFPIMDSSGRVVAFSGRVFYVSGASEDKTAKYVNSPETDLYNKSEILYGFDKAKQAIRKNNTCIFVEGQIDLVLSHQAGMENTVAVSGTALGEHHLRLIYRIAENLIFAFDADEAGVSAAGRGIDLALAQGFEVKMVSIPKGKDPADIIKEDQKQWEKVIADARHIIDFYISYSVEKSTSPRELRKNMETYVLPYIARLRSDIDKAQFVAKAADVLQITQQPVWDEVNKIQSTPILRSESITKQEESEKVLSRREKIEEKIRGIVLWQKGLESSHIDVDDIGEKMKKIVSNIDLSGNSIEKQEKGRLIFEAEVYCSENDNVAKYVEDLFENLKKEVGREEVVMLRKKLTNSDLTETQEEEILKTIQEKQKILDKE